MTKNNHNRPQVIRILITFFYTHKKIIKQKKQQRKNYEKHKIN